jgi:hypothetical protein
MSLVRHAQPTGPRDSGYAGNRVDAADRGGPSRFPESQVPFVRERLARLVEALRPRVVVSAAAAGADLLLLEEALAVKGLAVHVVLPFAAPRFRETSVADRGDAGPSGTTVCWRWCGARGQPGL